MPSRITTIKPARSTRDNTSVGESAGACYQPDILIVVAPITLIKHYTALAVRRLIAGRHVLLRRRAKQSPEHHRKGAWRAVAEIERDFGYRRAQREPGRRFGRKN
jgi:hypothetical protein